MKDGTFEIEFEGHGIVGDQMGTELPLQVLILHGAGGAHRGKMLPLRKELLEKGVGSCAFDFVGHGDTGGELKAGSLESRTRQARTVVDKRGLAHSSPLAVIAASMGGHIAVRLLDHYPIRCLLLLVPAMYNRHAYKVSFDQGFSEIIRKPESWRDSECPDILNGYRGKLLLVGAELDRVIPEGLVDLYYENAANASYRHIYTAPGVGHMVFTELREKNPREMEKIVDMMVEVIR